MKKFIHHNTLIKSKFRDGTEYVLTKQNHPDGTVHTFRHVIPYLHCYDQRVENYEGRMTGKSFKQAYCREYGVDEGTFERMCRMEVITLNNEKVTHFDKRLLDSDTFQVRDIRMDRPVRHFDKLEVIYENEDFVAVTKPLGVCVHPIRRYHKNSLFYMMQNEYDEHFGGDLHCKSMF